MGIGRIDILAKRHTQIFPTLNDSYTPGTVCSVEGSHNECPSAHWQQIKDGYIARIENLPRFYQLWTPDERFAVPPFDGLVVTGRNTVFRMEITTDFAPSTTLLNAYDYDFPSIAVAPHVAVVDALALNLILWEDAVYYDQVHRFQHRKRTAYTAWVPAPIAHTGCHAVAVLREDGVKLPIFPTMNTTTNHTELDMPRFHNLSDEESVEYLKTSTSVLFMNSTEIHNWASSAANSSKPELLWVDFPPSLDGGQSIGMAIALPSANGTQIWGCSIDARWADLTLLDIPDYKIYATRVSLEKWREWDERLYTKSWIRPSFAQTTNPRVPYSNSTVFEEMVLSAEFLDTYNVTKDPFWINDTLVEARMNSYLETILNTMIVNGMARTSPYTSQHGSIEGLSDNSSGWWKAFMPKGQFGEGGEPYNLTEDQKDQSMGFKMQVYAKGFGYSYIHSRTSRASIIILLIHLTIAMAFIIWSSATGTSSSSWDSPTELIALALASDVRKHRRGLATGASSMKSLKRRYCIITEGTRLQLQEYEGRVRPENRVKPNVVYE